MNFEVGDIVAARYDTNKIYLYVIVNTNVTMDSYAEFFEHVGYFSKEQMKEMVLVKAIKGRIGKFYSFKNELRLSIKSNLKLAKLLYE